MAVNIGKSSGHSDDRFTRLEDQLQRLRDTPQQLETILHIVTGLEAALGEVLSPTGRALLQSSAVARHPLWSRLKRHGSAPSVRPLTYSPASSQRGTQRKGTESSICTTRTAKDVETKLTRDKISPVPSPRLMARSRSFESVETSHLQSEASGTEFVGIVCAHASLGKVKKSERRDSRSTSAPSPRRPSFSKMFVKRPSLGNDTLSSFFFRHENVVFNGTGNDSPTHEKRPSLHSESGISEKSSRSVATGLTHPGTACIRRPSGFSDLSPKTPPVNQLPVNASITCQSIVGQDLPRIDSGISYFAGEKWIWASSFNLEGHAQAPACMILPHSWPRLVWDGVIMAMTTFISFVIPMGLVYFDAGFLSDHALRTLLFVTDLFWLADVLLNFRTGIYDRGTLILNPRIVACRYARRWLLLDVVVLCPVLAPQGSTWCTILQILKLLRICKFFLAFSRLQKKLRNCVLMPIKLILGVSMAAHLIACIWRAVQSADDANSERLEKWQALYVKDMYWVLMTMTTVGYGDIHPTGFGTRIYAIIIMVLSSLSFGAAITTISHLTRSFFNDEVEDNIAKAARFMRKKNVSRSLQHRVVNNLRHHLHQSYLSPQELFSQISPGLQRELSLSFLSEVVLKFPLFKSAHRSCVAELAQAHLWVECFQNDLVSEPGQIVEEVVFVIHGHLVAFCPPHKTIDVDLGEATTLGIFTTEVDSDQQVQSYDQNDSGVDLELNSGAWFGEACLLNDEARIRVATVMSVSHSELAVLKQKDYQRIIGIFPQLLKQHQNVQQALRDGSLTLADLAYKHRLHSLASKPSSSNLGSWILKKRNHSQVLPTESQATNVSERP